MNHPAIYLRATCRACRGPLREVLNLGPLRLNAFPRYAWEIEQIHRVPLLLMLCQGCGLVQLDRTVPRDWMYRQYYYRSGVNETMVQELQAIVGEAIGLVDFSPFDCVLDIGANDGTLLQGYEILADRRPVRYAVEPALNLQDTLRQHCDVQVCDYFPTDTLGTRRFRVITAVAMAYDVDDPTAFFQALHDHLEPGGVAIIQFQDLQQQLASAAFDTICHEHLEYYSLCALSFLFARANLTVQRVQHTPINGGSLRVILRRVEDQIPAEPSVAAQLETECRAHLGRTSLREDDFSAFTRFRERVESVKAQVQAAVETAREQGVTVDQYGASTKGNILLQVLGLGPKDIRQAIDRSPEKEGLLTITGIPIVGEAEGRKDPAGLWISPIWQFRESVLRREAWYLEQGGTILFPLPQVEIVTGVSR